MGAPRADAARPAKSRRPASGAPPAAERGFFARIFSREEGAPAQRYRIALQGDREKSVLAVLSADGEPVPQAVGRRIAGVLVDALR